MKKSLCMTLLLCLTGVVFFSLSGCSVTKSISERLNTIELNKSFNVTPSDLSLKSKCQKPPTVKIINIESRNENDAAVGNSGVNPKELMDAVVLFLEDGYKQSHINVDDKSTKVLKIRMIDLNSAHGIWSGRSHFKTELVIPETALTKTYESNDTAINYFTSHAYAIHGAMRQIIDDPLIQNYILCNTENDDSLNVQKERPNNDSLNIQKPLPLQQRLQELQISFDKGLISKEEYQLKRKDILEKY